MMDKDIVILSTHVLNLKQNLVYYLDKVNEYRGQDKTQKEAWERVEKELTSAGLNPRYTSYESFRAGQSKFRNK